MPNADPIHADRRHALKLALALTPASWALVGCSTVMSTPGPGVLAPKPLFRDPVFDGAADPSIVWHAARQRWVMFYTNRRANQTDLPGVTWVHGTPIGVADSVDGANWRYRGTVTFPADIPHTSGPGPATYWAPAVLEHQGVFHMYLTIVPGVFTDWNHPRRIVHLTSTDLQAWQYRSTLALSTEKVIDAGVLRLPDGRWRLWYNEERSGKKTHYADSDDLYNWVDRGSARLPDDRGEAPLPFRWQGRYWLVNDRLGNRGLAVYRSDDTLNWTRQPHSLLEVPGRGVDDQNGGHHPEVVVSGDRAFLYYFVHPGISADGRSRDDKRSSLQVVELQFKDGWLHADRDAPTFVRLLPPVARP